MAISQQTFARKKPDQLVYVELGSANGGMLTSISEDGFRFRAVGPLRANGSVPFAFALDGARRLEGVGEIEWLEDDGKSGGLRFTELSDESRAALQQWLSSDARQRRSGREAAPDAAKPLDTMQKIREDLRRGYPRRTASEPAPSRHQSKFGKFVLPEVPNSEEDTGPPPATAVPILERLMGPRPSAPRPVEGPQAQTANPANPPEQRSTLLPEPPAPNRPAQPHTDESPRTSRIPWRPQQPPATPPFSSSAFLKDPQEEAARQSAGGPHPASPLPPVAPATPSSSSTLRSFAITDTGDIASTGPASPPTHTSPAPAAHSRPYIPPPDDPYDAAWQHAKLSAPDSPHLSRAAAGSIIGLALVVILGALVVNFRQDIGAMIVELGRSVSGNSPAAASQSAVTQSGEPGSTPGTQPSNAREAQTPAQKNPESSPQNQLSPPASEPSSGANSVKPAPDTKPDTKSDAKPAAELAASKPAAPVSSSKSKDAPSSKARPGPVPKTLVPESELQQTSESGSGEQEFNIARDILNGRNRKQELPAAVALLWSGVRKGYVPAEVTLADMYRRGEGVEKNCDQAQVLLVAASRKGSADARQMLEYLVEHGGCQ